MSTVSAEAEPAVDALARAEKLFLDANRRTDEFLATLGHEMRNPLSALSDALQILARANYDPAQTAELCGIMQRQVDQLIRLSDDLLDVARIAQGKLELRRELVGLKVLIDAACEEVQPFVDRCGHTLTVRMPSWPVFVYGDSSRLIQAFANLIQNAAKFTERDGLLEISVAGQDGTAVIRIKDNGAGFAEHMRTTIFEPFTQVEGNVPLGQRGLGIGLRLVKTIVELHGGTVAARSEGLGQGSEFTVQLPAVDGASPVPPEVADPTAARGDVRGEAPPAHRIVVVDDDRSSAELLARMLRSIGQTVWVANDGATAIRTVLEERPQIVFLDIVMRGLDGCDVARALRGHLELDGLVLITLSGSGDEVTRRRALDAGFDKYVVKPTSIAALAEMLAGIPAAEATTGECNLAFPNFRSLGLEG